MYVCAYFQLFEVLYLLQNGLHLKYPDSKRSVMYVRMYHVC